MKILLLTVCLGVVLLSDTRAEEPELPLRIVVVPNKSTVDGKQYLTPYQPQDGGMAFEVVLTNTSDKPISLWKENCFDGWNCLALEVTKGGQRQLIERMPFPGGSDFDDAFTIAPSHSYVLHVRVDGRNWSTEWIPDDGTSVTLRVIYTSKLSTFPAGFGPTGNRFLWTGRVSSVPEVFIIR